MADDLKTGAGKIQDKPVTFCGVKMFKQKYGDLGKNSGTNSKKFLMVKYRTIWANKTMVTGS